MYCKNCGNQLKEGALFCASCGQKVEAVEIRPQDAGPVCDQDRYEPPYSNQDDGFNNVNNQFYPYPPYQVQMPPTPSMRIANAASSGIFLFAVILFTLDALWTVIGTNSIFSYVYQILNAAGMNISDLGLSIAGFSAATKVVSVIISIPSLLLALGLWLVYGSAKGKYREVKPGGITLIKVIMIIRFVIFCIEIFLVEIIMIICAVMFGSAGDLLGIGDYSGVGVAMIVLIMVVVGGMAAVYIIYYLKIFKMLGSAQAAVKTNSGIFTSVYVVVICFIMAVYAFYGFITSVASTITYINIWAGMLTAGSVLTYVFSCIISLCEAAAFILFAAVILKLRKDVKSRG